MDGIVLHSQALLTRPDWIALFGRAAPLLLEIGIGNGEFLVWLAQSYPEANCVGVEISREFLLKARNRIREAKLSNVRLVHIEGSKALSRLFEPESLSALYLNFPDPWHKRRHKGRRLVNEAFAWLLASRLCVGGQFLMVTDNGSYAQETISAFLSCPAYELLWETPIQNDLPDYFETKYARKWKALGQQLFYIGFRKAQTINLPDWVIHFYPLAGLKGDEPMPNAVLLVQEPVDWVKLWKSLPKGVLWQEDDDLVKVKGVYLESDGETITVDLIVVEGRLMQRFFAVVHSHRDGILVRLHEANRPDPTKGVHRAMALLTKAVLQLLPFGKAAILSQNFKFVGKEIC